MEQPLPHMEYNPNANAVQRIARILLMGDSLLLLLLYVYAVAILLDAFSIAADIQYANPILFIYIVLMLALIVGLPATGGALLRDYRHEMRGEKTVIRRRRLWALAVSYHAVMGVAALCCLLYQYSTLYGKQHYMVVEHIQPWESLAVGAAFVWCCIAVIFSVRVLAIVTSLFGLEPHANSENIGGEDPERIHNIVALQRIARIHFVGASIFILPGFAGGLFLIMLIFVSLTKQMGGITTFMLYAPVALLFIVLMPGVGFRLMRGYMRDMGAETNGMTGRRLWQLSSVYNTIGGIGGAFTLFLNIGRGAWPSIIIGLIGLVTAWCWVAAVLSSRARSIIRRMVADEQPKQLEDEQEPALP